MTPEDEKRHGYLEHIVPHSMDCARYAPYPKHSGKECDCPVKIVRGLELENRQLLAALNAARKDKEQAEAENDRRLETQARLFGDKLDRLEKELERVKAELKDRVEDLIDVTKALGVEHTQLASSIQYSKTLDDSYRKLQRELGSEQRHSQMCENRIAEQNVNTANLAAELERKNRALSRGQDKVATLIEAINISDMSRDVETWLLRLARDVHAQITEIDKLTETEK